MPPQPRTFSTNYVLLSGLEIRQRCTKTAEETKYRRRNHLSLQDTFRVALPANGIEVLSETPSKLGSGDRSWPSALTPRRLSIG